MKRQLMILCASLIFAAACLTTATPGSAPIETEVARQLTASAGLTQNGAPPEGTPQPPNGSPGELPTVTSTDTLPASLTPTETPTATPTLSFTPPLEDPKLTLGSPTFWTDFPNATNFYLYEDSNVRFAIDSHKFVMTAKQANSYDSWTLTAWKLTNFYMEIIATTDSCSGRDRYGLVVGVPPSDSYPAYLLRFSCDGYYSFGYFNLDIDNKFHYLKDWTSSTHILAGSSQTNRMGFKAEGTHLSMYANGHFLADVNEPSFGLSRTGLFIGSANTVNFTVRLSEYAYWTLP
ncbi:MAG: hypothetical protein ACK2UB_00915 [Anaerolineales bacterium]